MRQISLMSLLVLALSTRLVAAEPKELAAAKKEFAQTPHPDEAARVRYVQSLAALREKLARSNGDWQAVDAELKQHPAPRNADGATLSALRVGRWSSPRHEYQFRKDGSWTMLPAEAEATRGTWKIAGNHYLSGVAELTQYTIILVTAKDFIYTDGEVVFYEKKK